MFRQSPEFDLIARYFARKGGSILDVPLGDDAAVYSPPPGQSIVVSVDTVVEGRHFPANFPAQYVAARALGSALSDLAAMGATPKFFTLALTMPDPDPWWLTQFSKGLFERADRFGVELAGGDTTRGPLTISIQVTGTTEQGNVLTRSGAKVGDGIYVSGNLGDAAAGLKRLLEDERFWERPINDALVAKFALPEPRFDMASRVTSEANSAIDISDGLLAELEHLSAASCVGICVDVNKLPLSSELVAYLGTDAAVASALSGGDDYELLVSAPRAHHENLIKSGFHEIGEVVSDHCEVRLLSGSQPFSVPDKKGFEHFE